MAEVVNCMWVVDVAQSPTGNALELEFVLIGCTKWQGCWIVCAWWTWHGHQSATPWNWNLFGGRGTVTNRQRPGWISINRFRNLKDGKDWWFIINRYDFFLGASCARFWNRLSRDSTNEWSHWPTMSSQGLVFKNLRKELPRRSPIAYCLLSSRARKWNSLLLVQTDVAYNSD